MNITLDATTIPLLIAGVLGIIGAIVTGVLSIVGAIRQNTVISAVQENTRTTIQGQTESKERSDVIHNLVNSNTDKLKAEIEQLRSSLLAANEALADLRLIHRAPGTP